MNYMETLQKVDTEKALKVLGKEISQQGAYIHFPCPDCQEKAVIKAYGEKKNVFYCPKCKSTGHIISLTMKTQGLEWEESKKFLEEKALTSTVGKITKELTLSYGLEYDKYLENQGITAETAKELEVGRPKGKASLSGCIVFTVRNEAGMKVAYYGVPIKERKQRPPMYFNAEHYLYNFHRIDPEKEVYFTTDMFDCLRLIQDGKQAVCNFGLPYISQEQFGLLKNCMMLSIRLKEADDEIAFQAVKNLQMYFRIIREATK